VKKPGQFMQANPKREEVSRERIHEDEVTLEPVQRELVEQTIADHCQHRGWTLHAARCRTQHVHVVVTAADRSPQDVLNQFKAWCSRRLGGRQGSPSGKPECRDKWWTAGGSKRRLFTETSLEAAIRYVLEEQDRPR
jgi:REP element-mobilizing transposase RayT